MRSSPDFCAGAALEAFDALGDEPPELTGRNLRWLESDRRAFRAAANFEAWLAIDGLPDAVAVSARGDLDRTLDGWRSALPYTQPERVLVLDIDRFAANPELIRGIGRTTILESGVEKHVSGRELMQRWFKWRRGSDQFQGAKGVHRARTALYRFAACLVTADQLPPFDV